MWHEASTRLPRRCAPRNDRMWGRDSQRKSLTHYPINQSLRGPLAGRGNLKLAMEHKASTRLPRRCAPRNDSIWGHEPQRKPFMRQTVNPSLRGPLAGRGNLGLAIWHGASTSLPRRCAPRDDRVWRHESRRTSPASDPILTRHPTHPSLRISCMPENQLRAARQGDIPGKSVDSAIAPSRST